MDDLSSREGERSPKNTHRPSAASEVNLTDKPSQKLTEKIVTFIAYIMIVLCPLMLMLSFRVVKQYKRAIIMRFGKLRPQSPAGPGIVFVLPFTDSIFKVDLRTQSLNLHEQEIVTKDSVSIRVDAMVYFHVEEPLKATMNVETYHYSTKMIAIAMLRNILGQHTLTDLVTSRDKISQYTRHEIEKVTDIWGVAMERVEIKELVLPVDLQRAMAAEAEGSRQAKAKIIEAKGEIDTAKYLREAAIIMAENPKVMLLRYLETLNFIASQQATTVLFPFPVDIPQVTSMVNSANETDVHATEGQSTSTAQKTFIQNATSVYFGLDI